MGLLRTSVVDQIGPDAGRCRRGCGQVTQGTRFVDRLDAPERALLGYWLGKRADGVPPRAAIDPAEIPKLLRDLQLHERMADGRYLCRLSGSAVVAALGLDSTGRYADEIVAPRSWPSRKAMFDRALQDRRPVLYRARITVPGKEWRAYRRLLLPLARQAVDILLSSVHFEVAPSPPLPSDRSVLEQHVMPAEEMA
jgi:hypothetical protein